MEFQLPGRLRHEDHKFKACLRYRVSEFKSSLGSLANLRIKNKKRPGDEVQ